MLDYMSLSPSLKNYIFAIDPQMDDVDSMTLDKFELWATKLDALNAALVNDSRDPISIRMGWMADASNTQDNNTYLESMHESGDALDVDDFDGSFYIYLTQNGLLDTIDLYVCDNILTAGYIHIQLVDHSSTDRIFTP